MNNIIERDELADEQLINTLKSCSMGDELRITTDEYDGTLTVWVFAIENTKTTTVEDGELRIRWETRMDNPILPDRPSSEAGTIAAYSPPDSQMYLHPEMELHIPLVDDEGEYLTKAYYELGIITNVSVVR